MEVDDAEAVSAVEEVEEERTLVEDVEITGPSGTFCKSLTRASNLSSPLPPRVELEKKAEDEDDVVREFEYAFGWE